MDGGGVDVGPSPGRVAGVADLVRELALLRARAAHGSRQTKVSIAELARRIGTPRSTVHAYLTGKHLPAADVLDQMVIALGAGPGEQRQWGDAWFRASDDVHRRRHGSGRAGPSGPIPRQLPLAVTAFVGRTTELATMGSILRPADQDGDGWGIAAVTGGCGVGKTALAVRWAHQASRWFPDGQLWVDLRGYDPEPPLAPGTALGGFLRALGVPDAELPDDPAERASRYRSLLSGRRVLVVLDNAADTEQIRPLLPGTPSCRVLVTSRDNLAGLVARHGAARVELDVLPRQDAVTLLARLLGDRRCAATTVAALADRCGGLPLAVRIMAEVLGRHPGSSLAGMVPELAGDHRLLDLLDAGADPRTGLRAVLAWSYRYLSDAAAAALPRLARHHRRPGGGSGGLDTAAAGALTGCAPAAARRLLAELVNANLVRELGPDHYSMHHLVRAWAAELAAESRPIDAVPAGLAC